MKMTIKNQYFWRLISLFSFFLIFTSVNTFGQMHLDDPDKGSADILAGGCINIVDDNNGSVHNLYKLERVEEHFTDVNQLRKYLGMISNNRVTFGLNMDETAIMMFLHKSRVNEADSNSIPWWNNYISNSCIQL